MEGDGFRFSRKILKVIGAAGPEMAEDGPECGSFRSSLRSTCRCRGCHARPRGRARFQGRRNRGCFASSAGVIALASSIGEIGLRAVMVSAPRRSEAWSRPRSASAHAQARARNHRLAIAPMHEIAEQIAERIFVLGAGLAESDATPPRPIRRDRCSCSPGRGAGASSWFSPHAGWWWFQEWLRAEAPGPSRAPAGWL